MKRHLSLRYLSADDMNKVKGKATIFACGFDAAGFAVPAEPLETAKYVSNDRCRISGRRDRISSALRHRPIFQA
ncbi:MAG: hypothetical protein ABSH11_08080 [Verrucomicrobiota bacterium]|jgi:hypothetical protein